MPNEAKGAIVFVLGVLSGLAFVFALVMWGINKFGDQQGGLAEKSTEIGRASCRERV